eukprot:TRINITY_DN10819_c2_g1_i1.p2 TRINITY_DN10819_c2_g1~~TRINITY_DN10819_c2_g1_i1.p2  ORF type:complete len:181 (+),score=100.13 TRINITY_DN10819_c2_g1_i1:46-588(+)
MPLVKKRVVRRVVRTGKAKAGGAAARQAAAAAAATVRPETKDVPDAEEEAVKQDLAAELQGLMGGFGAAELKVFEEQRAIAAGEKKGTFLSGGYGSEGEEEEEEEEEAQPQKPLPKREPKKAKAKQAAPEKKAPKAGKKAAAKPAAKPAPKEAPAPKPKKGKGRAAPKMGGLFAPDDDWD